MNMNQVPRFQEANRAEHRRLQAYGIGRPNARKQTADEEKLQRPANPFARRLMLWKYKFGI